MSAPKLVTILGAQAKLEASYGAGGGSFAATDAIQLQALPDLGAQWAHKGDRAMPPGTYGTQKRITPSGRTVSPALKIEPKGFGAAYSASNFPPDLHVLMRASGHDSVVDVTPGAEKVTYTPTPGPTGFASVALRLFGRGEQYDVTHGLSDFGITIDSHGVPSFDFGVNGLMAADPVDAALPTLTYSAVMPPKAAGCTIQLGSFTTPTVRKMAFKRAQNRTPRVNLPGAAGHAGWSMDRRVPMFDVDLEKSALVGTPFHTAAGFDPWRLQAQGIVLQILLTVGNVLYNRWNFKAVQAQLVDAKDGADGATAITTLSFACNSSTPGLNDDYSVYFD